LRAWYRYAMAGLAVTIACAAVATLILGREHATALWLSAGLAVTVQLVAFAGLLAVRDRGPLFLFGWAGGMVLRAMVLAALAFWVSRTAAVPKSTALLGLVGFMFLLILLEPVFLRKGTRSV
jgi:hypothetical protein